MNTETTKSVDRNGNVSYTVTRDGRVIGTIQKTSRGYQAELPSGSYIPAISIKKATAILAERA